MVLDEILESTDFERLALRIFEFQAQRCAPYSRYLELLEVDPRDVTRVEQIPFLPIELFKSQQIYCGDSAPEAIFTSSGDVQSRHYVAQIADYERIYRRAFELFYGPASRWSIYALLPSYLEREGSSLVRMADGLIRDGRTGGRGGGFYLHDYQQLMRDMEADDGPKILLGVSYALLDLAELGFRLPPRTIVMETGGMKGRREEIPKELMHSVLSNAFGVPKIHSEYGMAELMSQAYSAGDGIFRTPPWMRIFVRDLTDPFDIQRVGRGGINIVDLGNRFSCAFIQTQDLGRAMDDGTFTLDGRIARSDIRGCNLLIQ